MSLWHSSNFRSRGRISGRPSFVEVHLSSPWRSILKQGDDQYEVRIKHFPNKTYFDDHIKVEAREKSGATKCERYIAVEEGEKFTIEITLHKGFDFGEYDRVHAQFWLPGQADTLSWINIFKPANITVLKSPISKELEYADIRVGGCKMLGTRFAFRGLEIGHSLDKNTDVMGIDSQSLGSFTIKIGKNDTHQQNLWDARKVDEDSFVKDGIMHDVGFVGGRLELQPKWHFSRHLTRKPPRTFVPLASRTKNVGIFGQELEFVFNHRTTGFLERIGVVKYPPPLYLYTWDDLGIEERKQALRDLQAINKEHVHQALEAKDGHLVPKPGKDRKKDEPKEWRAWTKMYAWEKELTFNTLKKAKRDHERGEVQKQFESNSGEIISLVDDETAENLKLSIEDSDLRNGDISDSDEPNLTKSSASRAGSTIKKESRDSNERPIKRNRKQTIYSNSEEDTSADERLTKKTKRIKKARALASDKETSADEVQKKSRFYKTRQDCTSEDDISVDEELEKKKAKARKLAEAIKTEKRLAKLQEEHRALEEEIEKAQRMKEHRRKSSIPKY
ncbi:hypothetical protein EG329_006925 [Mollisiaceae sp. DMI_Dod_QoI]|nr:hypothetical protein EG329_006925 [Helotiales sp. DMI_Dod_QoI]